MEETTTGGSKASGPLLNNDILRHLMTDVCESGLVEAEKSLMLIKDYQGKQRPELVEKAQVALDAVRDVRAELVQR